MMNASFDKPILTLTDAAAIQAKKLMDKGSESAAIGLRIGIKTAGCSGLQYQVEFAQEHNLVCPGSQRSPDTQHRCFGKERNYP